MGLRGVRCGYLDFVGPLSSRNVLCFGKQLLADCRDDKRVLSRRYVFALHGRGACAEANYELARRMGRGGFAQHCERCYHQ